MNPTSMRNKVKYGVFDRKTMRNTILNDTGADKDRPRAPKNKQKKAANV